MSKLVSINLNGRFTENHNIVSCLKQTKCKYIFDNELVLGMRNGDDIDVGFYRVDEQESLDQILKKWPDIASINIEIKLDNWIQAATFFLDRENNISFTIEGVRKKLDSGITDFSWYLNNMVSHLVYGKFNITSICCEEY